MRIVKPYARILNKIRDIDGISAVQKIEWCGRISHRSEDKADPESYKRILKHIVLDHGDWSIVEHSSVSVDALVDRGITHEWVRHRLFSYTQESTRFVNYDKQKDGKPLNPPSFIYPKPDVECPRCLAGEEIDAFWEHAGKHCVYNASWLRSIRIAEDEYKNLLKEGWRPQEARSVFPNALASRIIVTGNLRNWRHLFIMRTTQETHPQFRQVSIPLLAEFKETFPILFDDIEPNLKQSESMSKIR